MGGKRNVCFAIYATKIGHFRQHQSESPWEICLKPCVEDGWLEIGRHLHEIRPLRVKSGLLEIGAVKHLKDGVPEFFVRCVIPDVDIHRTPVSHLGLGESKAV